MTEPFTAGKENLALAEMQRIGEPDVSRREPRSYLPTILFANVGLLMAMLTPLIVSMAFKLQHITASTAEATAWLGIVLGVGAIFALFAQPLVGRLSDRTTWRFGMRRPWLLGGAAVAAVALAVIGLAQSVWVVLIAWCVAQIAFNAMMGTLNATIPDQVPTSRRGRVSGVMGIGVSIAILAGVGLVSALKDDWARFTIPGLIGLVAVGVFALVLPDRRLALPPADRFRLRQFLGSFVINPRAHPDFGWVWLTRFLVGFAYVGVGTFLPLYLTENFGLGEQDAINMIVFANIASTVTGFISGPLGGWLSDRLGRRRPFVAAGGIILLVGLVLLAFAPNTTIVIVAQALIGFGGGCFFAVDIALATQVLPNPNDTAKDLGVLSIAGALPQSLAPVVAPPIIAVGAMTAIGGFATFYLFAAALALAGGLVVYRVKSVP